MKAAKAKAKGKNKPVYKSKWSDSFYVAAYRLARQGLSDTAIAKTIGVLPLTLAGWKSRNPAFKEAFDIGRDDKKDSFQSSFRDYVYGHLPPRLRKIWHKINKCEMGHSGIDRVEALLAGEGKQTRQHLFLYAFVDSNFNASEACRRIGISAKTLQVWTRLDPEFAELMDEMHWHKGNFFEEGLIKLVKDGDTRATLFANERFNRNRGYGNKVEVNHSGQVNHLHAHMIDLETLDLPVEAKTLILEAVRKKKSQELPAIEAEVIEPEIVDEEEDE